MPTRCTTSPTAGPAASASAARSGSGSGRKSSRSVTTDAAKPATLIPALRARFVRSAEIATPMGSGVLATADPAQADSFATATHGRSLGWPDLMALAKSGQLEHR